MEHFYGTKTKQIMIIIYLFFLILSPNLLAQEDWVSISPPAAPSARYGHSMVTLPDGRVFLFGGEYAQGSLFNDLYVFESNGWAEVTPNNSPPPARRDHQAWTRGDAMYIYGGKGENGVLDDMWKYDAASNNWHQEELSGPRPSARQGHATTTLTDGSEIIVGGTGADGVALKDCWRLNSDNTFTQLQDAPVAYTGHSTELSTGGNWLYVFGKPGSLGIYRVSTDRWSLVSGGPPNGKGCMTSQGTNSAGEPIVFIFGGKDINGNEMNETYQFNLYGGELTQRGNMPQPIVNGSTAKIMAVPPVAAFSGLLKNSNLKFIQGFDQTTLVFGGVSNGVVTNNTYTFSAQTPPDTVTVIAVPDTIRADSVTFTWYSASPIKATYYGIELVRDTTTTPDTIKATTTDTTYTVTNLTGMKEYLWHIRAYNAGGWGNYNTPLHFFTDFVTGIETDNNAIPTKFELSQNYPNPFNPSTIIKYSIPTVGNANFASPINVQLKIYNALGAEVSTLVNKNQTPGKYEAEWNAANYPSGVYFYSLQAGDYFSVKKMCLLK